MDSKVDYDFSRLDSFVKAFTQDWVVQVGIFGDKTSRSKSKSKGALTNAELGFIHEYGSFARNIPARSFLRMPLATKARQIIADAGKGSLGLLMAGDIKTILGRLGAASVKWIQAAFATRGFGQWKADAPATIRRKHSAEPLIDTGQLRRAIAYKVAKK